MWAGGLNECAGRTGGVGATRPVARVWASTGGSGTRGVSLNKNGHGRQLWTIN